MSNDLLMTLVVITALGFDFTNGFHDTGNAMATSIATGALPPRVAVALSGVLNLVGAFLSFSVAATIASGLVQSHLVTPTVVFAGLVGGILWNLATWFLGIPSSSSHALIAALGTYLVYRLTQAMADKPRNSGFRIGQIGSASMVSLAHGTNDAQKTMGVITLALIANGSLAAGHKAPAWVIVSCALAISLGTYIGGWRVIRALGKGLVEIEAPQGMAAESASAAVILLSSNFGYSLSTTHVATGSILGSGVGKRGAEVRWGVAGRMATAWVLTLPSAGAVGAAAYEAAHGIGGSGGVAVIFVVLLAASAAFYLRSRQTPVNPSNVNDEWTGSVTPVPTPVGA